MIKSFHSLPPEAVHTYLIMEQTIYGVDIRAVKSSGQHVDQGMLMSIKQDGVHLIQNLSAAVDVETEEKSNRVRVFDHNDEELMTYREWARRTKEKLGMI